MKKYLYITVILSSIFVAAQQPEPPKQDSSIVNAPKLKSEILENHFDSNFIMHPPKGITYYMQVKKPDPIYDRMPNTGEDLNPFFRFRSMKKENHSSSDDDAK